MNDRYFVDANILMNAHDASVGAKHDRARAFVEELWRARSGVVSTQILFAKIHALPQVGHLSSRFIRQTRYDLEMAEDSLKEQIEREVLPRTAA